MAGVTVGRRPREGRRGHLRRGGAGHGGGGADGRDRGARRWCPRRPLREGGSGRRYQRLVRRDGVGPAEPAHGRARSGGQPRGRADLPPVHVARPDRRPARRGLRRRGTGGDPLPGGVHAGEVPDHRGLPGLPPRAPRRGPSRRPLDGVPAVPLRRPGRLEGPRHRRAAAVREHPHERDLARPRRARWGTGRRDGPTTGPRRAGRRPGPGRRAAEGVPGPRHRAGHRRPRRRAGPRGRPGHRRRPGDRGGGDGPSARAAAWCWPPAGSSGTATW